MQKSASQLEENNQLREKNASLELCLAKNSDALEQANREISALKDMLEESGQLLAQSLKSNEKTQQHRDYLVKQVTSLTEVRKS